MQKNEVVDGIMNGTNESYFTSKKRRDDPSFLFLRTLIFDHPLWMMMTWYLSQTRKSVLPLTWHLLDDGGDDDGHQDPFL